MIIAKLYLPLWTRSNSDYEATYEELEFDIYDSKGKIIASGFTREVAHSIVEQFNKLPQEYEVKE